MTVTIYPIPEVKLTVEGTYKAGEPEVNLPERFEIIRILCTEDDITNIIEWAACIGRRGCPLSQIEELCLENIH